MLATGDNAICYAGAAGLDNMFNGTDHLAMAVKARNIIRARAVTPGYVIGQVEIFWNTD